VLGVEPSERGGVRTVSIVRVRHAELFPTPIFEFQHGVGDGVRASLESGLDGWTQLDLPVLADATRVTPTDCTMLKIGFPAADGQPARQRRVLLGPTATFSSAEAPAPAAGEGEHCFCPCCLTTNCFDAFRSLIESEGTFALRLYAARNDTGE